MIFSYRFVQVGVGRALVSTWGPSARRGTRGAEVAPYPSLFANRLLAPVPPARLRCRAAAATTPVLLRAPRSAAGSGAARAADAGRRAKRRSPPRQSPSAERRRPRDRAASRSRTAAATGRARPRAG